MSCNWTLLFELLQARQLWCYIYVLLDSVNERIVLSQL